MLSLLFAGAAGTAAPNSRPIAIFDSPIGKICDPSSMELAAKVGLDGVELHMGRHTDGLPLRKPELRATYKRLARQHGLAIPSVVLGAFNQMQLYAEPVSAIWLLDAIDAAADLGARVILVPSFGTEALAWADQDRVKRFAAAVREAGPRAARKGVTLGLENRLSAEENLRLLDLVDAEGVAIYYDIANLFNLGKDPAAEIRRLGKERICQVHVKDNPHRLGEGEIDFQLVAEALDAIGYRGWLALETRPPGDPESDLRHNREFVRRVFG
jgi:sugar phosphate isomerase/epimerase